MENRRTETVETGFAPLRFLVARGGMPSEHAARLLAVALCLILSAAVGAIYLSSDAKTDALYGTQGALLALEDEAAVFAAAGELADGLVERAATDGKSDELPPSSNQKPQDVSESDGVAKDLALAASLGLPEPAVDDPRTKLRSAYVGAGSGEKNLLRHLRGPPIGA